MHGDALWCTYVRSGLAILTPPQKFSIHPNLVPPWPDTQFSGGGGGGWTGGGV